MGNLGVFQIKKKKIKSLECHVEEMATQQLVTIRTGQCDEVSLIRRRSYMWRAPPHPTAPRKVAEAAPPGSKHMEALLEAPRPYKWG